MYDVMFYSGEMSDPDASSDSLLTEVADGDLNLSTLPMMMIVMHLIDLAKTFFLFIFIRQKKIKSFVVAWLNKREEYKEPCLCVCGRVQ